MSWAGMPWGAAAVGALLGVGGSGLHLGITRWRAGLLGRQGGAWILATMPLSIVPPLASVVVSIRVGPAAVWASVAGLVIGRWLFMRRLEQA